MNKTLQAWIAKGVPLYYVRFHQPVAPSVDREPVSEFRLVSTHDKYVVQEIYQTPYGIIWRHKEEWDISSLANMLYCRTVL